MSCQNKFSPLLYIVACYNVLVLERSLGLTVASLYILDGCLLVCIKQQVSLPGQTYIFSSGTHQHSREPTAKDPVSGTGHLSSLAFYFLQKESCAFRTTSLAFPLSRFFELMCENVFIFSLVIFSLNWVCGGSASKQLFLNVWYSCSPTSCAQIRSLHTHWVSRYDTQNAERSQLPVLRKSTKRLNHCTMRVHDLFSMISIKVSCDVSLANLLLSLRVSSRWTISFVWFVSSHGKKAFHACLMRASYRLICEVWQHGFTFCHPWLHH